MNLGVSTPVIKPTPPEGTQRLLVKAGFQPAQYREMVFVFSEYGCPGTTAAVIKYINSLEKDISKTILVIGRSAKNLRYDDRFKHLKSPLFVSNEFAETSGIYLDRPLFTFVEDGQVAFEETINCGTFETAKVRLKEFMKKPYSNAYREV